MRPGRPVISPGPPCLLRDKSRQQRQARSLGDLQDLLRGRTGREHRGRKSEGKEYKIVRREYIY